MLHRIALPVVSEWCQTFVQSKESSRRDFPKAVQMISVVMSVSQELDCGSGSADHKHSASLTYLDGLVDHVHPYVHVCSQLLCLSNHLLGSRLSRFPQGSLVACGAASRNFPQTRKQIPRKALTPKAASSVTIPTYSLTGPPSVAAVATVASPRREYHNGGAD